VLISEFQSKFVIFGGLSNILYLGGSSSYCYDGGAASDGLNGLIGTLIQNL
jgi:hypothetical protein